MVGTQRHLMTRDAAQRAQDVMHLSSQESGHPDMHDVTTESHATTPGQLLLGGLDRPQRWTLALAAAVTAAAHGPVIAPHLDEAPYMGTLFIVLTLACSVLAVAALVRDSVAVYALSILTCGSAIVGYAATRLIAFPLLSDEVGNWLEPLGVVSIVAEAVVVASAMTALAPSLRQ